MFRRRPPRDRRAVHGVLRVATRADEKGDVRITGVVDADLTELLPASWAVAKAGAREYDAGTNMQLPTLYRGVVSAERRYRAT